MAAAPARRNVAHMFRNVLVGVDGRDGGRDAIALARLLAQRSGRITLAHVYDYEWTPGTRQPLGRLARHRKARHLLERERAAAGLDARIVPVGDARVATGLCSLAEARGIDVIVIGSSRRGAIGRLLLGDDAAETLGAAPCPVAIAPRGYAPGGDPPPEDPLELASIQPDEPELVGTSPQEGA
jgi:nucleotide-binding universal stress UspA family protein